MIGAWVQGVSESLKVRCSLHSQHTDTDPPLTDTKGVRSCLNVCCLWFILIKQLLPSRLRMRLMSHRARIPSLHCPRHHHQETSAPSRKIGVSRGGGRGITLAGFKLHSASSSYSAVRRIINLEHWRVRQVGECAT